MLDERKTAILHAVVEEYIDTAAPVGSGAVARSANMSVSSATVRNEMAQLEADGYLQQPHTSAGRVPTDKGYRAFVDGLDLRRVALPEPERVAGYFARVRGEIEELMSHTARLLSGLTAHTALVLDHTGDAAEARSIQLVPLGADTLLAVVVLSTGAVQKLTISVEDPSPGDVADAVEILAESMVGRKVGAWLPVAADDPRMGAALARLVLSALGRTPDDDTMGDDTLYVEGTSRVASSFEAADTVRRVLTILEEQLVVARLLEDVVDRGQRVAIGEETGLEPLRKCSVVVAPLEVAGSQAGSIAVLGPTRMNYPQALAAVAVVSRQLGHRLTEG